MGTALVMLGAVVAAALILVRLLPGHRLGAIASLVVSLAVAVAVVLAAEQGNVTVDINFGMSHQPRQPP